MESSESHPNKGDEMHVEAVNDTDVDQFKKQR